jgi:hypothetical protein
LHVGVQVVVSGEPLRCPAFVNVAWSETLPHFLDLVAFGVSEKKCRAPERILLRYR